MEVPAEERRYFLTSCLKLLGALGAGGVLYSVVSFLSRGEIDLKAFGDGKNSQAGVAPSAGGKKTANLQDGSVEIKAESIPAGAAMITSVNFRPVIVVNGKDGYKAFEATCTHLGCLVKWDNRENKFICPCHGGEYDKEGNVLAGPPPLPLRKCNVSETNGKIKVTLT